MPCSVRPKAKTSSKPKRPAHRPTKFTPELGEQIGALVACGWSMKHAARHFGIPPETVCRWAMRHGAFREAYAVARAERAQFWLERCIEIADAEVEALEPIGVAKKLGHKIIERPPIAVGRKTIPR
jgi:Bacteriophage Sf6, terminase small subunit-like